MPLPLRPAWGCLLCLMLSSPGLGAMTLQALIDEGRLDLSTEIDAGGDAVPGQRLRLYITLSTPRWFTGGTRITIPEVTDLVILQNQPFALNSSENREGDTWTVQRWTLDVFAMRPGRYSLPPIEVSASVSARPGVTAQGTADAPGIDFEVSLPQALRGLDHWVASPRLSLEQRVSASGEIALGDAVERRITLRANDVMAMMLPDVAFTEPEGLRRYEKSPEVDNRSNRGSLVGERVEAATYIAVAPGEVELPGIQVNWWNTKTKVLETVAVDGASFTVTGELPEEPLDWRSLIPWLPWLGLVPAVLALLRLAQRLGLSRHLRWLAGRLRETYLTLHTPALPDRLNPGGSAGETPKAPSR